MTRPSPSHQSPPLPLLPPRPASSHKGDYGRALLVGGSRGMSGAVALAGMATLRSGAGLVTLAVPSACADIVAGFDPCYMTVPLPGNSEGQFAATAQDPLERLSAEMTCVACGPGLGRAPHLVDLVSWIYQTLPQPLVLDADALVALAECWDRLDAPAGPRVLTPHPGEFRRFVENADADRQELERLAIRLAAQRQVVIVLKGHRTLITDGRRTAWNQTGNPGMATGGSGDVLTGVITALICQGLEPFAAAQLGAHLHGRAGDLAAERLGQHSLIAGDLIDFLPEAFRAEGQE